MPNIKSQIKRTRTNEEARQANAARKSEVRKKAEAEAALREAVSLLDRAAQLGVYTRNSADRKKAHLAHAVAGVK